MNVKAGNGAEAKTLRPRPRSPPPPTPDLRVKCSNSVRRRSPSQCQCGRLGTRWTTVGSGPRSKSRPGAQLASQVVARRRAGAAALAAVADEQRQVRRHAVDAHDDALAAARRQVARQLRVVHGHQHVGVDLVERQRRGEAALDGGPGSLLSVVSPARLHLLDVVVCIGPGEARPRRR